MNKKLIFVFIAVSLLLIAGCMGGTKKKGPITDVDIRKGTQGLTMSFTKNAPPERVFEDTAFPMALEVNNKGAENVVDWELVFGFETAYVGGGDGSLNLEIDGKSIFNPKGDEDLITINAKAKTIGAQSETQSSTILATACYPYKTILGTSVCIDTDIYGTKRGEKACSVTDLTFGEGQGAPVAVTKVETRMLPQADDTVKPLFLIHIKNRGNGEVVKLSKVENVCTGEQLDYTDFNTILISASLSGKFLDCRTKEEGSQEQTEIRLREKEDLVRCTGDVVELEYAYVSPLKVELRYGYTFTISKDIIIEKILTR